jgi:hypothetical protein
MEGRKEGGHQDIVLHDPRFPMTGKATNKDSLTATFISGSNAAGKALPPHFQFQTKATSGDRERIRSKVFAFTPLVIGQFWTACEQSWDCTFGLNTKGGMDDWEFELCIINSIPPFIRTRWTDLGRGLF